MTNHPPFKIRRAQATDRPAIIAIFNQAVRAGIGTDESAPVTVANRQDWFAQFDHRHPLWVITAADTVVGWCALEHFYPHPAYRDSAEIAIYIHQAFQRRGLGRLLLNYVDQQVNEHLHFKTVVAYIYERNHASQCLFASAGYENWGQLPAIARVNGEYRKLMIFGRHYPTA